MNAVQMLIGRGGWPMTVFLTPDGRPFYGGTYFPPEDRQGMPGFRRLLLAVARAYRDKPQDVEKTVAQVMAALTGMENHRSTKEPLDAAIVMTAAAVLARAYDETNGGVGDAPKFPNEGVLELFLRAYRDGGDRRYLDMVLHTLRQMAWGGIYDQVGGGFHRYSVDARWLVPHFEKMLYDNAQLVPLYLSAYQLTGDEFFTTVAADVLEYVMREMRAPEGGFYSTQDADSEGEEGKFFLWKAAEVHQLLGQDAAEIACRYWDISDEGNFEGSNIPHVTLEVEQLAKLFRRDVAAVRQLLTDARRELFKARESRVKPGRDEKILTSWNSLMISAFAKAAEVLGDERYLRAAVDAVAFVETKLQRQDQSNRLLSTYKDGVAKLNAYLDDYAFFVAALLDVYEAVQDRRFLERAAAYADSLISHFWDQQAGGFFFTSDDHENLIMRSKPAYDASIPSGNSVAARSLLRLYYYTGASTYLDRAEAVLRLFGTQMAEQPFGFASMLCTVDLHAQCPHEIVVVAKADAPETREMLGKIRRRYVPNRTLTVVDPARGEPLPPLVRDKGQLDGKPTVYVCRRMTCSPPATAWADVERLLLP
jgi:uncharacterized protein YyaL (SSP411 family)